MKDYLHNIRAQFRPENQNCDNCIHDFLVFEYQSHLDLVKLLEQRKMQYQKFFVALIAVIGTVSTALLNSKNKLAGIESEATGSSEVSPNYTCYNLNPDQMVGLLLIVSGFVAYCIIKNLSAIRRFEVTFTNYINSIREVFLDGFGAKKYFPMMKESKVNDGKSSDYMTIILFSAINWFMVHCGFILLINKNDITSTAIVPLFTITGYGLLWLFTIHFPMSSEMAYKNGEDTNT